MGKRSREKKEKRDELELSGVVKEREASKMEKIYLKVIEFGTYLVLLTPFIMVRQFFFPYVSPKTIFFRIIVDIILIAYTLLIVSNSKYRPRFNFLTLAVTAFVAITVISAFTGINFMRSFWSTFERMTGIITLLHLYAFYIVLTSTFKEGKFWERILNVSIGAGILVSFYTLTTTDPTAGRGGTLGNTSFLSAYLLFCIFFSLALFFVKKGFWKIFYIVSLFIFLMTFFFNEEPTQGAIGAFWVGVFLLCLLYYFIYAWKSGKKLLKYSIPAVIILIPIVVFGFLQTGWAKKQINDIEQTTSWQGRKVVWAMGIESWKDRPWLGWGPENFNVPFAKHFDPELPISGDLWYDRVHNVVIDTLVHSGTLGLLSYLSIFLAAFIGLLRVSLRVANRLNAVLPLSMLVLLAAYFAQNIWVFDMISSYMIFFLTLAFVFFLVSQTKTEKEEVGGRTLNPVLGTVFIIVALGSLYYGSIQPARASNLITLSLTAAPQESVDLFEKAIKASPMALTEGAEQFSRGMSDLSYRQDSDKELLIFGFDKAAEWMKKAIEKNPQDFRFYLILGRQYFDAYNIGRRSSDLQMAKSYLIKAQELSPNNQQVYWLFSQVAAIDENREQSIGYMQKAVDLEPRYVLANWYLAMSYKYYGNYAKAAELVERALSLGLRMDYRGQEDKLKQAIEIYQELGDDEKLIPLYEIIIAKEPNNPNHKAGMAAAYANLGQYEKARQMAEEALALKPSFASQLEEFLKGLPQ